MTSEQTTLTLTGRQGVSSTQRQQDVRLLEANSSRKEVFSMKVGEVAELAGVTVRTLHHYESLGLLNPSRDKTSGYRRYSDNDLIRLQQILFYRELGFSLEQIDDIMNAPNFDRREAMIEQKQLLMAQISRLKATLHLVDKTLVSIEGKFQMTKEEMFEVFGDFDPTKYEDEVAERWGDTDAYKQSSPRTAQYSKADWQRFSAEQEEVQQAITSLMDEGVPPTDRRATDAVERHRLLIDRWFYPCSRQFHRELGKMYIADERFRNTYDDIRAGMAQYVHDAIQANLSRGEK